MLSGKSNTSQKLWAVLTLFSFTLFVTPNCYPRCLYFVPQFTRYCTYYLYADAVLFCRDKPVLCSITRHMVPVIYSIDNWKCMNTSLPFSTKIAHNVVAIFVSYGALHCLPHFICLTSTYLISTFWYTWVYLRFGWE